MSATWPYVFRDGPALTATLTATRRRSRFCLQPRVHPVDGVGTLAGDRLDRVEVDLSRRAEARVPHRALDPLRCHLLGGEVAAEGVAEVVQPDRPDPGRLADLPPLAVDVARLDRRADRRREHPVEIIRPYRGGAAPLLFLRSGRTPAALQTFPHWRLTLRGSIAVPIAVVNTRSRSSAHTAEARRIFFCSSRHPSRPSTAATARATGLRDALVFRPLDTSRPSRRPVRVFTTSPRMRWMLSPGRQMRSLRSRSAHRIPSPSPRLNPVVSATSQ